MVITELLPMCRRKSKYRVVIYERDIGAAEMTGEEMSKATDLTAEFSTSTRELSPSVSSLWSVFSAAVKAASPVPLLAQHTKKRQKKAERSGSQMNNCSSGCRLLDKLLTTIRPTGEKVSVSVCQVNFQSASFTLFDSGSWCNSSNLTHHMEIFISPWDLLDIHLKRKRKINVLTEVYEGVNSALLLLAQSSHSFTSVQNGNHFATSEPWALIGHGTPS